VDTLYTDITNNLVVTADAGKDTTSCNHNPVSIGTPPDLGVRYEWSPVTGLSNPGISNPVALPDTTTTYVLTAMSKGGGCVTHDTVIVKASLVDNSIKVLGKEAYCIGSGDSTILVVEPADSIQWFKNNIAVPGANQTQLRVTQSGTYYAVLFGGNGCVLNTIPKQISIATVPKSSFTVNKPAQCLFGNQFELSNSSTNLVGVMEYKWDMGNGTILTTRDVTYSYPKAGNYIVKLVVSSIGICADSTSVPVTIYQNAVAAFDIEATCIDIPVAPVNNTADTLGSTVFYLWSFGNGQTSALRNPPAQVYPKAGNYNVSLSVSSLQCPVPAHIITRSLQVDRPKPAVNYPVEFAVINLPLDLHTRPIGETVLWSPAINLDNAASFNPVFMGANEYLYTIDIKTKTGCITTDTQLVKMVKSIEIYVPTAFTPDGDGKNDVLRPVMFGIKQLHYFRIFNRWGQLFYETQTIKQGWDGRFKSAKQEMQTLVWVVEALGVDGKIYIKKGATVLIR
jgi:gliding motility-associated-like protein